MEREDKMKRFLHLPILAILLPFLAITLSADDQLTGRRTNIAYAAHITTKTTTTPTSSTCYVSSVAICVTAAGTTQTLTIQDKGGTAKVLYTAGTAIAVGNTYINFKEPVIMTGGIDIISGGTTAGTQDVWVTYWQ